VYRVGDRWAVEYRPGVVVADLDSEADALAALDRWTRR
jgi:hypothetical protein